MEKRNKQNPPWWLFAIIAVGAFITSGIYIGIISVEGMKNVELIKAISYSILGLLMFWSALNRR